MANGERTVETHSFGKIKVFCPCDACGEGEPEPDEYLCPPCKAAPRIRVANAYRGGSWEAFAIDPETRAETYIFDLHAPGDTWRVWRWQPAGATESDWRDLLAVSDLTPWSVALNLAEDLGMLPQNKGRYLRLRGDESELDVNGYGYPFLPIPAIE